MIIYFFLVLIILYILMIFFAENFATQSDRAKSILGWARAGKDTYAGYRDWVGGTIVEYENIKKIGGDPTYDQIKKVL